MKLKKNKPKKRVQISAPKASKLVKVFDIPVGQILESPENPNEQDEAVFDKLVEGIKEDGFDEPCIVVPQIDPEGKGTGYYIMVSGHHRKKGGELTGMKKIPCIIKEGWDEDVRKIQLIRRNQLTGNFNPEKFTKLFNDMSKKYDKGVLRQMMAFTKNDAFRKVYREIEKTVTPAQRKKLAEAKESIKSVDDLSSILNTIFKEQGSDLNHGFMVFSFGGKNHHYFKTDKALDALLEDFEVAVKRHNIDPIEAFKNMLHSFDTNKAPKAKTAKKTSSKRLRKVKRHEPHDSHPT